MELVDKLRQSPITQELAVSESEYAERVRKTQDRMRRDGIDILLISSTPNLGYLTGYDTTMPPGYTVGILETSGEVDLHCSELEAPCALLFSTIKNISVFHWYDAQDTATQLAGLLRDRGADGKRIGIEMGNVETFASGAMEVRSFLRLKELLPKASFVDATAVVLDVRLIKSPAEIAHMRQAGQYTAAGLLASINAVAEGKTDNEVVAAGYQAMIAAGSELMSIDPMIMTGERCGYMPHIPYKRIRLKRGDTVYLEYSGCHHRYNAPSMRSAVVGKPSDGVKRLSDASLAVVQLLLENIRPGRTGHDVAQVARKGFEHAPDDTYFHGGFGYSIGMGFQPTWTENAVYVAEGCEVELQAGMTFHIPICTWVPSGKYGIGFSESVLVTESGCELLTPGRDRQLAVR